MDPIKYQGNFINLPGNQLQLLSMSSSILAPSWTPEVPDTIVHDPASNDKCDDIDLANHQPPTTPPGYGYTQQKSVEGNW